MIVKTFTIWNTEVCKMGLWRSSMYWLSCKILKASFSIFSYYTCTSFFFMITTLLQQIIWDKSVSILPPLEEGVPSIIIIIWRPLICVVRSKNIIIYEIKGLFSWAGPIAQKHLPILKIPYPYFVNFCGVHSAE